MDGVGDGDWRADEAERGAGNEEPQENKVMRRLNRKEEVGDGTARWIYTEGTDWEVRLKERRWIGKRITLCESTGLEVVANFPIK